MKTSYRRTRWIARFPARSTQFPNIPLLMIWHPPISVADRPYLPHNDAVIPNLQSVTRCLQFFFDMKSQHIAIDFTGGQHPLVTGLTKPVRLRISSRRKPPRLSPSLTGHLHDSTRLRPPSTSYRAQLLIINRTTSISDLSDVLTFTRPRAERISHRLDATNY